MLLRMFRGIAQSVRVSAGGWTIQGSNPDKRKGIFSSTKRPDRGSVASLACSDGCRIILRGLSGRGVKLTTSFIACQS